MPSRATRFAISLAALAALACGGRGDIESSELYEVGGGASTSSGGSSSAPDDRGRGGGDTTDLGRCERGFPPNGGGSATCDWLGSDGLCYATREAACACVCPRDRDSICRSGFPSGPGGRTPVDCS